jgi:hypothetical protein
VTLGLRCRARPAFTRPAVLLDLAAIRPIMIQMFYTERKKRTCQVTDPARDAENACTPKTQGSIMQQPYYAQHV